jgi:hypothetical protein
MTTLIKRPRPNTKQLIAISQWMMQNQGDAPKTAATLAAEAAQVVGTEIAPLTIKKIASQLGITLRRQRNVRVSKKRDLRLDIIAQAVVDLYRLAGADERTVEDVRSKLFS